MKVLIVVVVALATLWGWSKAPATAQQATVTLTDGSTFSGTVTSNSSSAISLQSSTGEARTYPMSQVASVQYAVEEFRTIPAGTTITVRNNDTIDSQTAQAGQTFGGVVERNLVDTDGRVAIPKGANATLVVRSASGQARCGDQ